MPGNASGGMDGVAVKPLTVGFHENPFLGQLSQEHRLAPWAMLSEAQRRHPYSFGVLSGLSLSMRIPMHDFTMQLG